MMKYKLTFPRLFRPEPILRISNIKNFHNILIRNKILRSFNKININLQYPTLGGFH